MNDDPKAGGVGRWALKATLVILWTFIVVAGYFWAHKPFDAALLSTLAETLLSIAVWLGVSALGAALGRRALAAGGLLGKEGTAVRLALAAGLGLGVISLLVWGLGMISLFRPWAAWALMIGLAILVRRDLLLVSRDLRALRLPRPENGLQRWIRFYGIVALLLAFLSALAPPTAWDSLVYHLTGPRLYVEAGRILQPFDLPYLGMPQLAHMQFTVGMLLLSDGPAALFHFGYGLMAVTMTAALTGRAFGRSAAWFAGALLLSVPTLFSLMSRPYVDATLLFYATAAFYVFLRWRASHSAGEANTGWLVLLGLFCGFGGGVKYTAVAIPFALGLSIIWVSRRDGLAAIMRRLALVAAISIAVVLPWVLENWLTTGNPVYPFFFDDALYWDVWRGWWYDRPGTGLAATASWRLLIVPLEATVLGTEGTEFYEATLGPLLLVAGGLLLFVWRSLKREEKAISGHMALFFVLNYILWLNGVARTALLLRARFLLFTFGVVAALGGLALARLPTLNRPQLDVSWLVRTVFSLTLALVLFTQFTSFLAANPLPAAVGIESESHFLRRQLGLHPEVMERVNELPAGSRVVFLWEPRSYLCEVDCRPDALLDRFLHHTHYLDHDAGEIADAWRSQGMTHVLLYQDGLEHIVEAGFDPVTDEDLTVLRQLQEEALTPVADWDGAYLLYALER